MRRAVWEISESCLGAVWDLCGAVWEKIEKTVQETLVWLDKNQLSEKEKFEARQRELEGVANPIMIKCTRREKDEFEARNTFGQFWMSPQSIFKFMGLFYF